MNLFPNIKEDNGSIYHTHWVFEMMRFSDKENTNTYIYVLITKKNDPIIIIQLEDEYFYVSLFEKNLNTSFLEFKCDQIDGVKELLKDLKVI